MTISNFISNSESDTRRIAADFARTLQGNEKICLTGPLGAGKTTFVRGFVEAFGISSRDVQSPTFTLVREYGKHKKIYHVDLYRLEKEDEIIEAGTHELLGSNELVLIEWADRLVKFHPVPSIRISLTHEENETRIISIETIEGA